MTKNFMRLINTVTINTPFRETENTGIEEIVKLVTTEDQ